MRHRVVSYIERLDQSLVLGACLFFVGIVGAADYFTGHEIAFSIFYVAPIALAAYFIGRRGGLIVSLLSAATWLLADVGAGHDYEIAWVPYWNAFTRLLFFALIAVFLAALREAFDHEKELARSDFLTGAANSRAFYAVAEMELVRARRYGRPFSLAHIDVDNFKTVNDTLGHQAGDDLLRAIVATMQSHVRETDLVARLGGDEFALLLPETGQDEASIAMQKLHGHLNEEAKRRQWPVSFSVGLLTCLHAPQSVDDLLKLADKLTYEAKGSGKNTIKHDVVAARLVNVVPEQS